MGAGKGKGGGDKEWGGVGEHGGEMRGRDVRPEAHACVRELGVPRHVLWDISGCALRTRPESGEAREWCR